MRAITVLMDEHRVVERVIEALETATRRLEAAEPVRPGFFIDAAEFIQGFADGCHHHKEEDVLFKTMVAHGLPTEGGPIGVMLAEHEQARSYTRAMRAAAERLDGGDAAAADTVVQNATGYVALLRQHILKEDQVLFPMAEQVIPAAAQHRMMEAFERVEEQETGQGVHDRFLAMAERLEQEMRG